MRLESEAARVTCGTCGDHGLVRLNWSDKPEDFGICLCRAGLLMRDDHNGRRRVTPQWAVWATKHGIDPSRFYLLEEAMTPEELAERGFTPTAEGPADRLEAIVAAAKRRK